MLLENGMSIPAVAKMAGHDNIETTLQVYTHMTNKMEEEAQSKIFTMSDGT